MRDQAETLLEWYDQHARTMPWRVSPDDRKSGVRPDPYHVWMSEIMLQQTRVAQGTPYYLKFLEHFPTVHDLAKAPEEKVLKLWQGLGYYSRARNLHATAKIVSENYDGKFPDSYKGLLQLKGVGDYTASAIASICYNVPEPVVDGNVYRVLARYFGIATPINSTEGIHYFKNLAREVMHTSNIRDYNQGIMEFGALQCAPKKPYCLHCPLNESCVALQQNKVAVWPVKIKKTKIKERYFNYILVLDANGKTLLRQRLGKGIWQNLFEFPLLESAKDIELHEVKERMLELIPVTEVQKLYQFNTQKKIVHKLSHQHLHTKFWIVETQEELKNGIAMENLGDYAVPVLIADFIDAFKNSYF